MRLFYRNLKRDKLISIINIVGLVTGILSALFILEYVYYERSYDSHHKYADDIYRLAYNRYNEDELMWETANSFFPAGDWLKDNYSEVVNQARITPKHNLTVSHKDESGNKIFFNEPKAFYGTTSMFEVFTIPLIQGLYSELDQPFTVAISKDAAQKYFGFANPVGKVLNVNGTEDYTVCAVYENIPSNSIIKTNFLFSMETLYHFRPGLRTNWGYDYGTTYLQLKPGTNQVAFAEKALPLMVQENYKDRLDRMNKRDVFYLQALKNIHLTSNIEYETVPPGNGKIIDILWGFSIFLLIVAWINYVNLITARAVERAKEIGVRKVNGATRLNVLSQFVGEAFLFNVLCLLITIVFYFILNPLYRSAIDIDAFNLFKFSSFILTATIAFIGGVLISCIYPALVLQSYKPITVLKGKFIHTKDGILFRKGLVTLQFIISIVLLSGTIIANRQAKFLIESEMGVDYNQSLVIRSPQTGESKSEIFKKLQVLKDEFVQIPHIKGFTFTSDVPMREIETWFGCRRKGYDASDQNGYFQIAVDDQFLDFYNVKMLAGRKFFVGESAESNHIIMNLKGIQRMGVADPDDAINTIVIARGKELKIVGVTDDFHYKSIKNEPVPTVITLNDHPKKFLTLKISNASNGDFQDVLLSLKQLYTDMFPDQPFDYYWVDDMAQKDLKPDKTFSFIFGLFSVLAILIAVIGIVGLLLITINQRIKELGIRKALGAPLISVSKLLVKEISGQVILAIIIATPLAWYGFQHWFLWSYILKVNLGYWMFVFPVILLFTIIFIVIHFIAVNAFRRNVSEVLQNE